MNSKGFTIIELLVVVAIIAVLAAIVLVNVTGYINQGKNAAIKGNMTTILTNAAVWIDNNSSYAGFSTSAAYSAPAEAAKAANGGTPLIFGIKSDTNTQWCTCSVLKTTSTESGAFCVDSTGFKGSKTACTSTQCSTGTTLNDGICKG